MKLPCRIPLYLALIYTHTTSANRAVFRTPCFLTSPIAALICIIKSVGEAHEKEKLKLSSKQLNNRPRSLYFFTLYVAMPARQLKSNKKDQCQLFLFSFQLICLPSLQFMIGIKIREYHTCGITHFFLPKRNRSHRRYDILSNNLNTIYFASSFAFLPYFSTQPAHLGIVCDRL